MGANVKVLQKSVKGIVVRVHFHPRERMIGGKKRRHL